ncbi:MAG: VOC family protein [Azospirillaceae bacterium]
MAPPPAQFITFITGSDLERSTGFYRDDLGLPVVWERPGLRIFQAGASGFVGVIVAPGREPSPAGITLALVVDDVEGMHRRLVERGVAVRGEPAYSEAFDNTFFFTADPDGHAVEIVRMQDPAWRAMGGG